MALYHALDVRYVSFSLIFSPLEYGLEDNVVLDGDDGDCEAEERPLLGSGYHLVIWVVGVDLMVDEDLQVSDDVDVNKVRIAMEPGDPEKDRIKDSEGEEVASLGDQSSEEDGNSSIQDLALGAAVIIIVLIFLTVLLYGSTKRNKEREVTDKKENHETPSYTSDLLKSKKP